MNLDEKQTAINLAVELDNIARRIRDFRKQFDLPRETSEDLKRLLSRAEAWTAGASQALQDSINC